jgi:hypothetical protein
MRVSVKARRNTYGSYQSLSWGTVTGAIKNHSHACPTVTILHAKNEVFQRNRNDFPKVSFTFDVI